MIFKPYECAFGVTINSQNYDFDHVQSFAVENPEKTRLIRGANAGNTAGLIYKEGLKEPKVVTVTIAGMNKAIHDLLLTAYNNQTRLDCYCTNLKDGSTKTAKNAVLSQEPQQLTVDDSADSLNVSLVFESFDVIENHKS